MRSELERAALKVTETQAHLRSEADRLRQEHEMAIAKLKKERNIAVEAHVALDAEFKRERMAAEELAQKLSIAMQRLEAEVVLRTENESLAAETRSALAQRRAEISDLREELRGSVLRLKAERAAWADAERRLLIDREAQSACAQERGEALSALKDAYVKGEDRLHEALSINGSRQREINALRTTIATVLAEVETERARHIELTEQTSAREVAVRSEIETLYERLDTSIKEIAKIERREAQLNKDLAESNVEFGTLFRFLLQEDKIFKFMRRIRPSQFRNNILEKGLFNPESYLSANPDVAEAGVDPFEHYIEYGINEERRRK